MEFDLMTRRKITQKFAQSYQKAPSRKAKSLILDEFTHLTGYNRSYASWLLRNTGKKVRLGRRVILVGDPKPRPRGHRRPTYGPQVLGPLRKIWAIMDFPCGRRLKAILPRIIPKLEAFGEIELEPETRELLMRISASTIDRGLAPERKSMQLKPRSRTKPGTLLKRQIPIRTFSDWDEGKAGFIEIDLVSHDGGFSRGDFCYTLVLTDVKTQWTEVIPVRNRAQVWVFEALKEASERFPFPLRGIDSDNDSAFINYHLLRWCEQNRITFTRSRPYQKNDNCHVEQKRRSVVRRYAGYFRYEGEEALGVLREMGQVLRLYVNYFQPSMKLLEKVRQGSKVKKRYDDPKTPYERVLECEGVSEKTKEKLREEYEMLNPAALRRRLLRLQDKLIELATSSRRKNYALE